MGLSLADLDSSAAVFREIDAKYGKLPTDRKRKWTVADLHFNKPSHEALAGYDSMKQFTMALGKSNGRTIPLLLVMPLEVAERGSKERQIPIGTINDK